MGRKPKKKIGEMSVANGKIWNHDDIALAGYNPYLNLSLAEYENQIKNMNTFDLQSHAVSVLVPVEKKRESLINNLIKEFQIRKNII